jgi:tRNA acetyltransferase TAN1
MVRCTPREQYKIELRIRNHSTFTRQSLIEAVADSVPKQLKVDLEAPEVFILMEVFKVRASIYLTSHCPIPI